MKYLIKYREVGCNCTKSTTYIGKLSREEVIDFFGLDGADISWYEVTPIEWRG